ncbi:YcgN family cysteine cluster protein [Sodalis sp. dw_96]|uniref:YcgN family cysteine cluster protein n=1 Tax=Sodalis sp. dw_96 TaxID=2719794 RepID=UPI001BD442D4|nr:YcgN family cysteine cluster protein [Sodalis sp. dw_96]
MTTIPFWQEKSLDEMTDREWESLCDGCGRCCLHKYIDGTTQTLHSTNVACKLLNIKTCQCRHYETRFQHVPGCIKLTRENIATLDWLPPTCAYRLKAEGKPLPNWHPLITGSKAAMHGERISVRHIAVPESALNNKGKKLLLQPARAR